VELVGMKWHLNDLVGTGDIAREHQVDPFTIQRYRRYPDFPEPLTTINGQAVYSREAVNKFLLDQLMKEVTR
jgi:hypothetical protein